MISQICARLEDYSNENMQSRLLIYTQLIFDGIITYSYYSNISKTFQRLYYSIKSLRCKDYFDLISRMQLLARAN